MCFVLNGNNTLKLLTPIGMVTVQRMGRARERQIERQLRAPPVSPPSGSASQPRPQLRIPWGGPFTKLSLAEPCPHQLCLNPLARECRYNFRLSKSLWEVRFTLLTPVRFLNTSSEPMPYIRVSQTAACIQFPGGLIEMQTLIQDTWVGTWDLAFLTALRDSDGSGRGLGEMQN